jgi:hypothetical protein
MRRCGLTWASHLRVAPRHRSRTPQHQPRWRAVLRLQPVSSYNTSGRSAWSVGVLRRRARGSLGGGVPFFRVRLNPGQHNVLVDLENRVSGDAVVRYAAPVFHEIEGLWERQATRMVFKGSAFIPPSAAGTPPTCWTYDDGGSPIFCSEPRCGVPETSDDVLRAVMRTGRRAERPEPGVHLRALASRLDGINLTPRRRRRRTDESEDRGRDRDASEVECVRPPLNRSEWTGRLRAAVPERSENEVEAAVDAAVVANLAESIGLTWFLAEIHPRRGPG